MEVSERQARNDVSETDLHATYHILEVFLPPAHD